MNWAVFVYILSCQSNHKCFLNLLGTELDKLPGISVQHAAGDADYDIYMRRRSLWLSW